LSFEQGQGKTLLLLMVLIGAGLLYILRIVKKQNRAKKAQLGGDSLGEGLIKLIQQDF
jgi:hypothetical protein